MKVNTFGKTAALGIGSAILAVGLLSTPAQADPDPLPDDPTYVAPLVAGTGSDTTQDVMQRLAANSQGSGTNTEFESWNAGLGRDLINPKGLSAVTRPNGSSEGRDAFRRAQGSTVATPWAIVSVPQNQDHFDFARSSSGPSTVNTAGELVYVPFAVDFVQYAYHNASAAPDDLTKQEVIDLYSTGTTRGGTIDATVWNGTSAVIGDVTLYIPQSGSGTRSFWLSAVGLTETTIPNWVFDRYNTATDLPTKAALGGTVVQAQEHDGTVLAQDRTNDGATLGTNNAIVPFSGAQWAAQANSGVTEVIDRRNGALLGGTAADFTRLVYNIVRHNEVTNATSPINDIFATNGTVCSSAGQATIALYGFKRLDNVTDGLFDTVPCGQVDNNRRISL